eukprot:CAMPEP_0195304506 /NCGR_PEP_ID=MMETSP0707-20130614/34575_1 /TAXON_ID=33640 /ORGANISM="Asterionellopsis glacialis, Strain CCMP134" /LENGTH=650 /DNA_ID=CAMNT_0040368335 /DNA_START=30 /DNA_END=1982 /DNA_ORIENTATION=-
MTLFSAWIHNFSRPSWFNVATVISLVLVQTRTHVVHAGSAAAAERDLVNSLPGYDGPLPSEWFSGFLEYRLPCMGNKTIHTHYIYIKKQNSGNVADDVNSNDSPPTPPKPLVFPIRGRALENKEEDQKVKSDRTNNSYNDNNTPLIFWSNGGPGASSLFGLFTEIGPFQLNENSLQTDSYKRTGIPTLFPNTEFSWNTIGDLLIFDAPAPVGYSYCDDKVDGDGLSCGGWDDESSAWNNYHALLAFYEKFPRLLEQPLYLTGESYAGIYIPSLARKILQNRNVEYRQNHGEDDSSSDDITDHHLRSAASSSSSTPLDSSVMDNAEDDDNDILGVPNSIPLKGFAVGDACVGSDINCSAKQPPYFDLFFFAGHGQISLKLYSNILKTCGIEALQSSGSVLSPECQALLAEGKEQIGGFYEYSLYDDCTYSNGLQLQHRGPFHHQRKNTLTPSRLMNGGGLTTTSGGSITNGIVEDTIISTTVSGALNDYVCGGGSALNEYVAHPKVKQALHVSKDSNFFDGDNGVGFNYSFTEKNLMPFYVEVAKGKYAKERVRVVVYNGDTDPSINSFAAQNWTSHLGLEEIEEWRPWTIDSCRRMGGFVTQYEGFFDYLTIRGAGHMVPTYKPAAAFSFLKSWVENSGYPLFNSSCNHP